MWRLACACVPLRPAVTQRVGPSQCIIEDRDVTKRRGGDAAGAFGTDQVHDAMNDVCGRVNPEPPASDAGGAVGYKPPALQAAPTKHGTVHNPEYGGQAVYFAMTPGQANQSPGVRHQQQLTSQPQPHQGFGHPQQPGTVVSHAPIQQAHGVPPSVYPSTAAVSAPSPASASYPSAAPPHTVPVTTLTHALQCTVHLL